MGETLRQAQDYVLDGVREILGISIINLIRGTLSVEADALNRLEMMLNIRPKWCDKPTTREYLLPKFRLLPHCLGVWVTESENFDCVSIQLQFTIPLEPTSTVG